MGDLLPPTDEVGPSGRFLFHPQGRNVTPGWVKLSPRSEDPLFLPFILLNFIECSSLGVNEGVNIPPR
jgi:hypothetical protein